MPTSQHTAPNQDCIHLQCQIAACLLLLVPKTAGSGPEARRSEVSPPHSSPQLCKKPHWLRAPAWPSLLAVWKHSLFCSNSSRHCCFQKTHIIILFLKKELQKAESETLKAARQAMVSLTLIYHHISSPTLYLLPAPTTCHLCPSIKIQNQG